MTLKFQHEPRGICQLKDEFPMELEGTLVWVERCECGKGVVTCAHGVLTVAEIGDQSNELAERVLEEGRNRERRGVMTHGRRGNA